MLEREATFGEADAGAQAVVDAAQLATCDRCGARIWKVVAAAVNGAVTR
jgi:hypothetical protein